MLQFLKKLSNKTTNINNSNNEEQVINVVHQLKISGVGMNLWRCGGILAQQPTEILLFILLRTRAGFSHLISFHCGTVITRSFVKQLLRVLVLLMTFVKCECVLTLNYT